MFADYSVKRLPDDKVLAAKMVCDRFFRRHNRYKSDATRVANFDRYLEALAFAHAFADAYDAKLKVPSINYERGKSVRNLKVVVDFFNQWRQQVRVELRRKQTLDSFERAKDRYGSVFGKVVLYEFSNNDFGRVQALINELRDLIGKSKQFDEDHKRRLLKRLEKLQAELHKKMSNLDMLWGLIGDAGVALGKFGKDAKPLVDRIGEILQIVCRTQAKAEKLRKALPLRLLTDGEPIG